MISNENIPKMALQEILSLGLGGAAVATLYIFNVSYILLAISCLFLVHTTSKLFIREPSEEFEEEKHINIKTIIEVRILFEKHIKNFLYFL